MVMMNHIPTPTFQCVDIRNLATQYDATVEKHAKKMAAIKKDWNEANEAELTSFVDKVFINSTDLVEGLRTTLEQIRTNKADNKVVTFCENTRKTLKTQLKEIETAKADWQSAYPNNSLNWESSHFGNHTESLKKWNDGELDDAAEKKIRKFAEKILNVHYDTYYKGGVKLEKLESGVGRLEATASGYYKSIHALLDQYGKNAQKIESKGEAIKKKVVKNFEALHGALKDANDRQKKSKKTLDARKTDNLNKTLTSEINMIVAGRDSLKDLETAHPDPSKWADLASFKKELDDLEAVVVKEFTVLSDAAKRNAMGNGYGKESLKEYKEKDKIWKKQQKKLEKRK